MAVVERRGARDVAQRAFGKELFQIILARIEIGDGQRIGVVAGVDIVGRAWPVRRRRAVPVDGDRDRHDRFRNDVAEFRPVAPVDENGRQVEQKVDDARRLVVAPDQAAEQLFELRPDSRQGRQRSEKRIEDRRAHDLTTFVIPGRREAASPESITTIRARLAPAMAMDSGLLATLGPGMTKQPLTIGAPPSIYPSPGRVRGFRRLDTQ